MYHNKLLYYCPTQTCDETNPSSAVEEVLDAPDKLKDLDLDAFAEELERQMN